MWSAPLRRPRSAGTPNAIIPAARLASATPMPPGTGITDAMTLADMLTTSACASPRFAP